MPIGWRGQLSVAALLTALALAMPCNCPAGQAAEQPAAASEAAAPDPQVDLAEALARGDRRFVGLAGPTLVVPGVDDYAGQYRDSHGVRLLPVADESAAGDSVQRNLAAYRYALRYNQLLLEQLRSQ